jgi:O-antigen/teichoic acid export membrane protein
VNRGPEMDSHQGAERRRLLNVAMLYASKAAGILVGILVLPRFNHLLGPQNFGVVAVILSVQALLLMLDLGMSTLVGRDVAASGTSAAQANLSWRTANLVLTLLYLAMALAAWPLNHVFGEPLNGPQLAGCLVLFWALTLQNVSQTALLAARRYAIGSGIQLVGVLTRALVTLAALQRLHPDLTVFVATQALCALLQLCATHWACRILFTARATQPSRSMALHAAHAMLKRGSPLVLYGLAGAAVMQLDKPIVSALASAAEAAPYYLATILCLAPLSSLGGPVAQFYQPRLVRAISTGDDDAIHQTLVPYTTALALVTFIPSALLWLFRAPIIDAWLGHATNSVLVARYTGILLPGAAIGALGYVPTSILVARQDFRFQALTSAALTLLTLAAAAACAHHDSIVGVCWVYAGYHCLSTVVTWGRCTRLDRGGTRHANAAGLRAAALAIAVSLPVLTIALGTNLP